MREQLHNPDELEGRGVYLARTLTPEGHPWYYAVNSHNRECRRIVIRGAVTPEGARRILWAYLDQADPLPCLRLVRSSDRVSTGLPAAIALGKAPGHVAAAYLGTIRSRRPA